MKKILIILSIILMLFIFINFKEIKAFEIDETCSNYLSQVPDATSIGLGKGVLKENKVCAYDRRIKENLFKNTYIDVANECYAIYGFDRDINTSVYDFTSIITIPSNVKYTYQEQKKTTKSYVIEKNVTNRLNTSFENTSKMKVGSTNYLKIEENISAKIENSVSSTYKKTTTIKEENVKIETYEFPISNKEESYIYQQRANFKVYLIDEYQINYKQVKTNKKWHKIHKYYTCSYETTGYTLKNEYVVYKYIDNSLTRVFAKLKLNEYNFYEYDHKNSEKLIYIN